MPSEGGHRDNCEKAQYIAKKKIAAAGSDAWTPNVRDITPAPSESRELQENISVPLHKPDREPRGAGPQAEETSAPA